MAASRAPWGKSARASAAILENSPLANLLALTANKIRCSGLDAQRMARIGSLALRLIQCIASLWAASNFTSFAAMPCALWGRLARSAQSVASEGLVLGSIAKAAALTANTLRYSRLALRGLKVVPPCANNATTV